MVTPPGCGSTVSDAVERGEPRVGPVGHRLLAAPRTPARRRSSLARQRDQAHHEPAFHGVHAVGPVASESASVSACEEIERLLGADRVDHRVDRWRDRRGRARWRSSGGAGASARGRRAPPRRRGRTPCGSPPRSASTTPLSVWSPGRPLPRSCSSAPTSRRSGRRTRRTRSRGARDRLEEVTIDGEAVERVALREAPHHVPLGEELHQQPVLVEQLELRDRGVAAAEERDEGLARLGAPTGRCTMPRLRVEASQRRARDRHPEVGGVGGGPQHERGSSAGDASASSATSPSRSTRPGDRGASLSGGRAPAWSLQPRPHRAPRVVGLPGDGARRRAHHRHQLVGIAEPQRGGDVVLVLEQQPVGAAGQALQRDAGVEQRADRGGQPLVGHVHVGDTREGAQGGDVAAAAPSLLEVGLERVGDVAGRPVALLDQVRRSRAGGCGRRSRQSSRMRVSNCSASTASPATTRPSSRPSAAFRSRSATARASFGVRTL